MRDRAVLKHDRPLAGQVPDVLVLPEEKGVDPFFSHAVPGLFDALPPEAVPIDPGFVIDVEVSAGECLHEHSPRGQAGSFSIVPSVTRRGAS